MSSGSKQPMGVSGTTRTVWPGRSHISVFIHCLHLLDLDLHNDWPGINEQTFSTRSAQQNVQQRIKAVEWSLYHLFEKFDPQDTRTSLNLRAALLRALTELKKNGTLGREVILRKTMLDECKGEKFEELLSSFAMVVLRKEASQFGSRRGAPNFLTRAIPRTDVHCLPLILAHRNLLSRRLARRTHIREQTLIQQEALKEYSRDISTRRDLVLSNQKHQTPAELERVMAEVRESWYGDLHWIQALLYGGASATAKEKFPLLMELDGVTTEQDSEENSIVNGLVRDLTIRVSEQQARLQRWQELHQSLPGVVEPSQAGVDNITTERATKIRFDRHKLQNLSSDRSAEFKLETSHANMLHHMHEELSGQVETKTRGKYHNERRGMIDESHPSISLESSVLVEAPGLPDVVETRISTVTETSEQAEEPMLQQTSSTPQRSSRVDGQDTLDQRTRKSMATVASLSSPPFKPGSRKAKDRRSSQIYPINQFETPHAVRSISTIKSPTSGDSTPRDKLFEGEADYASVFKSRPRIALSPTLSPKRSTFELDSKLQSAMNELELDSGEG